MADSPGRVFRDAWIAGVKKHHPSTPAPGDVASWEEIPKWERKAAAVVGTQILDFIRLTAGGTEKLTRKQKGRFVTICWIGQIHKHVAAPEQGTVRDWNELPKWRRETNCDIFEAIEQLT